MRQACVRTSNSAITRTVSYVSGQSAASRVFIFARLFVWVFLPVDFVRLHYAERKIILAPGVMFIRLAGLDGFHQFLFGFQHFPP